MAAAASQPGQVLAPGYFLAHVRQHDWPPGFVPQVATPVFSIAQAAQQASLRRARERKAGASWAVGTVLPAGGREGQGGGHDRRD